MQTVIYKCYEGEYGFDSENGSYYVYLYDASYESCDFDTEQEAKEEFEFQLDICL